jgi:hypothetical protein
MPDDSLFIFGSATGRCIDNLRMTGLPLRVWQLSAAVVFATVAAACAPLAAQAHVGSQSIPDAAYYRTELSEVTPLPAGVTVRVDPGGDWVELSNTGEATVIVLGYSGEPYLRVTPTGVAENQLSQTTYLNRSLFADSLPTGSDAAAVPPRWNPAGTSGTVRWHDHRIHWMGQVRPPEVAADPRHAHPVGTWVVRATAGAMPFEIRGGLRWMGKPDSADARRPIPEWLLATVEAGALGLVLAVGLGLARRRRGITAGR